MSDKLISVDFYSSFGFLKKPDINADIYFTFNCLHKPALLGILGSIIGLQGYYQSYEENPNKLPEYFIQLQHLKIGIAPINSHNGNFPKTLIKYNNSIGYANRMEDKESGDILNITEQTLISPSYRIYLLLNMGKHYENELYNRIFNHESDFIPYLGKNDFQLWWKNQKEYKFEKFDNETDFKISTIFYKEKTIREVKNEFSGLNANFLDEEEPFFSYFERLPIEFSPITKNYEIKEFTFTTFKFPKNYTVNNLYEIIDNNGNKSIIQLF